MTDTTPMRERLAAIVYDTAIISNEYGTDPDIANAEAIVDAILSMLETPSDTAINTVLDESSKVYGHTYNAWGPISWHFTAMVKAIRGGA